MGEDDGEEPASCVSQKFVDSEEPDNHYRHDGYVAPYWPLILLQLSSVLFKGCCVLLDCDRTGLLVVRQYAVVISATCKNGDDEQEDKLTDEDEPLRP